MVSMPTLPFESFFRKSPASVRLFSEVEQKQAFFFFPSQSPSYFGTPPAGDFIELFDIHKLQGLTGTNFQADGVFHKGTPVAFESEFSFGPRGNDPVGAEKGTSPAGDTAVLAHHHQIGLGITDQRGIEAGIQTGGLQAMATLQGEADFVVSFHAEARLGQGRFLNGSQQGLAAASPFCRTIELTGFAPGAAVQMNA
jgi:hypothetical protein